MNDEFILKIEDLIFERHAKVSLDSYKASHSLLYIDHTIVQEYMNGNSDLEQYFQDKKEKLEEEQKKDEGEGEIEQIDDDQFFNLEAEDRKIEESKGSQVEETKGEKIDFSRPISGHIGGTMVRKSEDDLEYDIRKMKSGTNYSKYTNEGYMKKIQSLIPIQNRIFKIKSTSMDIWTSDTFITAQRNLVNDGKSKKATLSRTNSMTYDELVKVNSQIEILREKHGERGTPIDIPVSLYSPGTLDTLNLAESKHNS